MALFGFVKRVRIAASPFPPKAWEDPATIPTAEFDRAVEFEDIWLAPATVKGYSDADLVAFPVPDRDRLRAAVTTFRAVANAIPDGAPATGEQVREALPAFATILDVLKPHLADGDLLTVRRAIWRALEPYREWILTFDFEMKPDSSGDPAVYVWLILKDDVDVETREVQDELYDVRAAIRKEFTAAGITDWLYASVWGRSEVPGVVAWEPV
jgi:hypothetical protein